MNRKTWLLLILSSVLLLGGLIFAYQYMSSARADAASAREDLDTCYRLAGQIEAQSNRPALATDRDDVSLDANRLIDKAAKAAGIVSLASIDPDTASQRLGESDYKEKPTSVRIENVSLQQLVAMLHGISNADKGLLPKSIRLAAPREDIAGNGWTAELSLTYLIYSPAKGDK